MPMQAKKKKRIIVTVAVLGAVTVLLVAMELTQRYFLREPDTTRPLIYQTGTSKPVYLEEPDPDFDIFDDPDWLDEDRLIHYFDGSEGTVITWERNEAGMVGVLFLRYFDALMKGDCEAYNALFTQNYFADREADDYFTMQRVYNISVTKTQEYTFTEGQYAGLTRYLFTVEYCIMRNDGTFRDDIPSDFSCPMIFELISNGETVQINGIERVIQAGI